MSFWTPVLLLLRSRNKVAYHALAQNPTACLWTILLACLLALAAFGMGHAVGAQWHVLTNRQAEDGLQHLWLLMQCFWLLAMLLPSGISLLGQTPPRAVLRPFALRPIQTLIAETLAGILDIPGLLALVMTLPLVGYLLAEGQWGQALVTCIAFALIGLQTGILARLLVYMGMLGARRLRRLAQLPGMTALLLFLLCAAVPPALASLTTPSTHHKIPDWLTLPSVPRLNYSPAFNSTLNTTFKSAFSSANIMKALPAGLAAHAVACARQADYPGTAGALGTLAISLGLTGAGAVLALRRSDRNSTERAGRRVKRAVGPEIPGIRAPVEAHIKPLSQLRTLIITEWRLLLRGPQTYLPLRKPASLLLLSVFAFMSPDMSRNPVYNLKELLGIGTLLYGFLWQLQFLCNRFGNEAGTGALLFGFSLSRCRLLVGKNSALLLLLLCLDSAATVGLSYIADASERLPLFLLWLPLILVMLTALGNVVSALHPFAIARQDRRAGVEPPDNLAWIYVFVGCSAGALLVPVAYLLARGMLGLVGAALYLGALYALSLLITTRLLARSEHRMIAALDNTH